MKIAIIKFINNIKEGEIEQTRHESMCDEIYFQSYCKTVSCINYPFDTNKKLSKLKDILKFNNEKISN